MKIQKAGVDKMSINKILPKPTHESEPYWRGCHNHELLIQQCNNCGVFQFYPRSICTSCMSENVEWVQSSGKGKVVTYTIVYRAPNKAFEADLPYVIALIKLDEGPTMMSNIVHCEPKKVKIGMEVKVFFEDWSEEITIAKFEPE